MKIALINDNTVKWSRRGRKSKYQAVYDRIRELKLNETISIEFDNPIVFGKYIYTLLRHDRKQLNGKIRIKLHNLEGGGTLKPSLKWAVKRVV